MQQEPDYDLEDFQNELYKRIEESINNNDPWVNTIDFFKEGKIEDISNLHYDVCYFTAVGKSLEDLAEYYEKTIPEKLAKNTLTNIDLLQKVQAKRKNEIIKLQVILQKEFKRLVAHGVGVNEALAIVANYP